MNGEQTPENDTNAGASRASTVPLLLALCVALYFAGRTLSGMIRGGGAGWIGPWLMLATDAAVVLYCVSRLARRSRGRKTGAG